MGVSCLTDDAGLATNGEEAVEVAGVAPVAYTGGLVQIRDEEC
jgi:hypothetical protein